MKPSFPILLSALFLAGCQSAQVADKAPVQAEEKSQWQPSTLSEQTIAKANAATRDYQKCLSDATSALINEQADPRALADAILQQCESKLTPIKTAFDAENVPSVISERYMRKNRSHGAQNVLRFVMSVQALRASEEEETQKIDNKKK